MSIKHMTHIWEHSESKGSELLVLLAYADFANDDGESWPSITTIAERARISARQAKRIRQALISKGLLELVAEGGGRGHTDVVKVCIAKGDNMTPFNPIKGDTQRVKGDSVTPFSQSVKGDNMTPFNPIKGDTQRVKGDMQGTKGDIAMSPDPLVGWMDGSRSNTDHDPTNQPEPQQPTAPISASEQTKTIALLRDPDVCVESPKAISQIAQQVPFKQVLRHVGRWLEDDTGAGLLVKRIREGWATPDYSEAFRRSGVFERHAPEDEREQAAQADVYQISDKWADLIYTGVST